jgi:hypothetical protein
MRTTGFWARDLPAEEQKCVDDIFSDWDRVFRALQEIACGADATGRRIPRDGLMGIAQRTLREIE